MKRPPATAEIDRGLVEGVAAICGPSSAAALALKDADAHNGTVRFYQVKKTIIVEKL